MRHWRQVWQTLALLGQENPPQLVEMLMLSLAMGLFGVWIFDPASPYLLLGLTYTVGACASILVREALIPTVQPRPTQVVATLLLLVSLGGFADLVLSR